MAIKNKKGRVRESGLVGGKGVRGNLSDTRGRVSESGLVGGKKNEYSGLTNPRKGVLGI